MSATEEKDLAEVAELLETLERDDVQKVKGVIVGIQLARETEQAAG